jgi:hypothetical protein
MSYKAQQQFIKLQTAVVQLINYTIKIIHFFWNLKLSTNELKTL